MNNDQIRAVVIAELSNIAPEADMATVTPESDIRETLDIDSMDFLNFITAIHQRLGVDIPERDYPKLFTLAGAVEYLGSGRRNCGVAGGTLPSRSAKCWPWGQPT
jgi:acyl carrier protein